MSYLESLLKWTKEEKSEQQIKKLIMSFLPPEMLTDAQKREKEQGLAIQKAFLNQCEKDGRIYISCVDFDGHEEISCKKTTIKGTEAIHKNQKLAMGRKIILKVIQEIK